MTEGQQQVLPVVAIDGPSAAGKSTVAQKVAGNLGIRMFDTGLLYRATALLALRKQVPASDGPALANMIERAHLDLSPAGNMLVEGADVSGDLRSSEIESIVSDVSAHPEVRDALYLVQRRIAETAPVVMVGRDITTVVVPDAGVRIYLDASPEERARRRYLERQSTHPDANYAEILEGIRERDRKDSTRETAPLRAAKGVTVINTDGKSIDEVVDQVTKLAREQNIPPAAAASDGGQCSKMEMPPVFLDGSRYGRGRRVAQFVNGWWIQLISKLQQEGEEHIPPWGPLLYVSNHLHNFDPAIEFYGFPRPIHFMGKQELFRFPVIKQIAEVSGGFPVDRGKVDREALRNAEHRLERGITVGMYPEGGRSPTGGLTEGKAGAGMLALKTGAPILPVAITGSERLPLNGGKGKAQRKAERPDPGHKGVRIVYGAPFTIPRQFDGAKISSDEATEIIMLEIARLLPESYRGVYADRLKSQTVRKIIPYSLSSCSDDSSSKSSEASP